jgi:uncharacterized small protein (DUF1192 family)
MFPSVKRTPSQVRYADHAAVELDDLSERVGIMRSEAARLEEEKRHIAALLDKITASGELSRCGGECRAAGTATNVRLVAANGSTKGG